MPCGVCRTSCAKQRELRRKQRGFLRISVRHKSLGAYAYRLAVLVMSCPAFPDGESRLIPFQKDPIGSRSGKLGAPHGDLHFTIDESGRNSRRSGRGCRCGVLESERQ